jgi:enoyl-CoA hydratase
MSEVLRVSTRNAVRTISLNRPQARNAMSKDLLARLVAALNEVEAEPAIAVVILTGEDPAFCAGLDLVEFSILGAELLRAIRTPELNPFETLKQMTKPVIAAVNGAAITGGLELVLNCDFIIASEWARFGLTQARLGTVPGGGTIGLLSRAIGVRRAKELTLTSRMIDAEEALRMRLVNRVVAHDELVFAAAQIAAAVAQHETEAVRDFMFRADAAALGSPASRAASNATPGPGPPLA